jgi:biotin carboxyl carrier protein
VRRHEYELDGREHAVELREDGDRVFARVTTAGEPIELELRATRLGDGRWLVRLGDRVQEIRVEPRGERGVVVRLPDGAVPLERLDPFRDPGRGGRAGAGGARKVTAPMPGRVVSVLVAVGDTVTTGQPVAVVEAMKMANELRSPIDGRVTRVDAAPGAAVEAGSPLVVIEG